MNYDKLVEQVQKYFNDTSRPAEQTKSDLKALQDEIEILIDSMD